MAKAMHPIKTVARRTGLTAHVIRIWEKRYGAVKPERTDTNRRLYSDEEIERLSLLRDVTRAGQSIGLVATMPNDLLRELASKSQPISNRTPAPADGAAGQTSALDDCISAVRALDSRALEGALKRGAVELGTQGLLQRVVAPLAQVIGELWRDGAITAAHEHFASAIIRVFLGQTSRSFAGMEHEPVLVVATPSGQLHELGALLVGATATNLGWHVTHLGASLPAAEIAGAARQNRARAVALSIVYPDDDPRLESELTLLRELLPAEAAVLVGGRAMAGYGDVLERIGALQMKDLAHLCATLDDLRRPTRRAGR